MTRWTWPAARSGRAGLGFNGPGQARLGHTSTEPLWLEWLALTGILGFCAWLLGVRGVWALLLGSDPTGITLVIIVLFACATLWCGGRARVLAREHQALHEAMALGRHGWGSGAIGAQALGWAQAYWAALGTERRDAQAPLDVLLERTHGPHGTAWWVNGIQLKLGLLGKVIGFSVLALEIGQMRSFDPTQSQELLKSLTAGLGIALLTTMVGLVGNILLGLQLTRLDRSADALVTMAQEHGLRLHADKTPASDAASRSGGPTA